VTPPYLKQSTQAATVSGRRSAFPGNDLPDDPAFAEARAIGEQLRTITEQLALAIKAQVASGDDGLPNANVRRLTAEGREVQERLSTEIQRLQDVAGIPESVLEAIEASELPTTDDRFWRSQVEQTPASESLNTMAPPALDQLMALVDQAWLASEATKPYRLDSDFLRSPLHLVSGTRVGIASPKAGPQRFARMLLVCRDFLDWRLDLDFFSAPMLVSEVAILGNSLRHIEKLGDEAQRKLARLHLMNDDEVSSTVYELLVGAACVREGLDVTMLPPMKSGKSPDFRVTGLGGPDGAIECKRRLGLTHYEMDEARHVEALYFFSLPRLEELGIHCSITAIFRTPVTSVDPTVFSADLMRVVAHDRDFPIRETSWGAIGATRLPYTGHLAMTRVYSPQYLQEVFGWDTLQSEWDGLLCQVEPPQRNLATSFKNPICLKWRSESREALTKKARGITSLWADAAKQIPAGDVGFVYVAYPEGARETNADARTRNILESAETWWHRWSVRIPLVVIARLYARPLGDGLPDFIESVLPATAGGEEFRLARFPTRVFTLLPANRPVRRRPPFPTGS
jgi:hypothetical protein